jgi:2-hydroxy-3-oxopropionate reductase
MEAKAPMMLDRNFKPGFRINLHIKDLTNALDTGHSVGAPVPLTAAMLEMMTALEVDGRELDDHSALVLFHEKLADIELSRGGDR